MHKIFENTNLDIKLPICTYKKGEIVFNEGELATSIGLIINGNISVKTYTYYEKEYEINNISKDGIFGQFVVFSSKPFFVGTAVATKETQIMYISKDKLFEFFKNRIFFENYLSLVSAISITIQNKVKVLSQKEIKDKILFLLVNNLNQNKSDTIYISSKDKLARYLNVTRPSLSRELINMKNDELIDFGKHFIKLNKKSY